MGLALWRQQRSRLCPHAASATGDSGAVGICGNTDSRGDRRWLADYNSDARGSNDRQCSPIAHRLKAIGNAPGAFIYVQQSHSKEKPKLEPASGQHHYSTREVRHRGWYLLLNRSVVCIGCQIWD